MNEETGRMALQRKLALPDALSLGNHRLFAVAVFLSIVPLWIGRSLPMVDMPQHAAQIAALQQIWAGNETFTQVFEINWFTPYLLGYLLLYLAASIMPIAAATQVVVSLALISMPFLVGSLLRAVGADERWRWLSIPSCFSFAFYWGFLSFIVAAPFALLFLILTVRFAAAPSLSLKRGLGIAMFAILLFFCHVIVLGYASLVALGYVVGSNHKNLRKLLLAMLPYTAPLPLIAAWLFVTYNNEAIVRTDPIIFGPIQDRFVELLVQPSGRDAFSPFVTLLVTGAVAALPWMAGSRFSRRPERWLPFALGLATFLAAPAYVLSTAYFYQRLGIFLVPLWLMAWDPPAGKKRAWDWAAMLVVLFWVFTNTGRFAAFARETQTFDDVIAAVEPGRRVASMVFDNSSPLFAVPVYLHFPAWYQAKRAGIVDFNFADFFSQMVRYKADAGPRITDLLGWYPTEFRWELNGGDSYDYFIVKSRFDVSSAIFKDKRDAVELVTRSGWWWLYRNKERQKPVLAGSEAAGATRR